MWAHRAEMTLQGAEILLQGAKVTMADKKKDLRGGASPLLVGLLLAA